MLLSIILINVFTLSFSASPNCGKTSTGIPNHNLFIPNTWPNNFDPCEKLDKTKYNKLYPHDGKSWNIEHIIELKNSEPELESCDKDIFGNVILADATWNRAVGNLCWKYCSQEKMRVYGPIFSQAMNNVRQCCNSQPPGISTSDVFGAAIGAVSIVIILGILIYLKNKQDEEKQMYIHLQQGGQIEIVDVEG